MLSGMEAIAPYIFEMGWWLIKRTAYPWFIVGDNPVTVWPGRDHPEWRGVGFASRAAEVACDLVVGCTGRHQLEHLLFARGQQRVEWRPR